MSACAYPWTLINDFQEVLSVSATLLSQAINRSLWVSSSCDACFLPILCFFFFSLSCCFCNFYVQVLYWLACDYYTSLNGLTIRWRQWVKSWTGTIWTLIWVCYYKHLLFKSVTAFVLEEYFPSVVFSPSWPFFERDFLLGRWYFLIKKNYEHIIHTQK